MSPRQLAVGSRRPTPPDDLFPAICAGLRRRGWEARVTARNVGGETDVRLEVGPAADRSVELLGAWGNTPCGDRWHAVRVYPESRAVWCGPPRTCRTAELIEFIDDLLTRDPVELTCRYTWLG